jgi:arylsulfatase A-like enzyme
LISIDAFRADLLQDERWRSRLPRLAQLAQGSLYFSQARSPGSSTRNSLGQLFSSKYSAQLRWTAKKGLGPNLREDPTPRLSNLLGEAGFSTVFLSTYPSLTSKHAIAGSFQHEQRLKPVQERQRFPLSDFVVDAALEQLEQHGEGPTFLYMHWLDAHDPYDAAGTKGTPFQRYLREVELCDHSLGRLIDELRKRSLWQRTVLVVTADHGEALGEHGIPHHGQGLYDVLVRVPLIVSVPGVAPRRVHVPVTTLDIAPTLLDLLGLPTPGEYMGQSLVGFLRGATPKLDRPIALDESRMRLRGLIVGPYKIIDDKKKHIVEIYDLSKDPGEAHNLFGSMADGQDQQLLGLTRAFFAKRDVKAAEAGDDAGEQ